MLGTQSKKESAMRWRTRILLIAAAGPFIPISVISIIPLAGGEIGLIVPIVISGYLIGFIPALFCGFIFYFLSTSTRLGIYTFPSYILGALSGAIVGGIIGLIIQANSSGSSTAIPFFVTCTFSGLICGKLFAVPNKLNKQEPAAGTH